MEEALLNTIIRSYVPNAAVGFLEGLIEKLPLSHEEIMGYCRKSIDDHIRRVSNVIQSRYKGCPNITSAPTFMACNTIVEDLIRNCILERSSIHRFDIYRREEYLEAIRRIRGRLKDKIVVYEGAFAFQIGDLVNSIYYFVKEGRRITRLRNYAVKSIRIDKNLEAHLVPRESIENKLVLVITIRRGQGDMGAGRFLDLYWIDSHFFTMIAPLAYKVISGYLRRYPREECEVFVGTHSLSEFHNYDVDPTDRIMISAGLIDRLYITNREAGDFEAFAEKFFSITGRSERFQGKHEQVVEILETVARLAGYTPRREYSIGDSRLDIVWSKQGRLIHVFEVVVHGSIKEALYRLSSVGGNVKRILILGNGRFNIGEYAGKYRDKGVIVIGTDEVFDASRSLESLEKLLEKIK